MATNGYDLPPLRPLGEAGPGDEDRLPWLESAEDDYREGPAWGIIIVLVLAGLAAIAGIIWGVHWYRNQPVDTGTGATIAAPPGDYKVKPDEPGGMKVEGEGETALATSQGGQLGNASINLGAAPETPIQGTKAGPGAAPQVQGGAVAIPASGGKLAATRPNVPQGAMPTGSGGGALVQIGSFPSAAEAQSEWASKAKRFGYLAPLGHSVERAEVRGNTVFRLRVNAGSAGAAQTLCGKLKVAGEACFIPN